MNEELKQAIEFVKGLEAKFKGAASQEELKGVTDQIAEFKTSIEKLNESVKDNEALVQVVKSLQSQIDGISQLAQGRMGEEKVITLEQELKGYEDLLKKAQNGDVAKVTIELKAAAPMVGSAYFDGNNNDFANATRVKNIRQKPLVVLPFVTSRPTTLPESIFVEESSRTDAAEFYAEGGATPQGDRKFKIVRKPLVKVGEYFKIAKEKLTDFAWLQSWVNSDLVASIDRKADAQMYGGTAESGVKYAGILSIATLIDAAKVGTTRIANANQWSCLAFAAGVVKNEGFTDVTRILVNPLDWAVMTAQMTEAQISLVAQKLGVMPDAIQTSPVVTAGTFLMGDFSVAEREYKNGVTLEIFNQNEDDAIKDLVMVKGSARHSFHISENDYKCFAKGTYSTIIAALTAA